MKTLYSFAGILTAVLMASTTPKVQAVVAPPLECQVLPAVETVCAGIAAEFTATIIDPLLQEFPELTDFIFYTVSWTGPGGFTSTSATISVTQEGIYVFTVTDNIGRSSSCSAVLIVEPCEPGATRTMGYWQTHYAAMQVALNEGCVDLGVLAVVPSGVQDLTNPTLGEVEAILWGQIGGRSPLGQARMQLAQQLIAAMINVCLVGTSPQANGFSPALIADARAALDGTDVAAILSFVGVVDQFNNSGDNLPLTTSFGPAKPKLAQAVANPSPGPAFE